MADSTHTMTVEEIYESLVELVKTSGIMMSDDEIEALISEKAIRNIRIRSEFNEAVRRGEKQLGVLAELEVKYHVNIRQLRRIISKQIECQL